MGWRDWLQGAATKASAVSHMLVMSPGQPKWMDRDYKAFADEGYRKNVVAYQCVSRIGSAVSDVRWTAWRGDAEITESPLLDLLAKPNPRQSCAEYVQATISYLMLSGNRYEERIEVAGEPRELYTHRPDRMKVVPGADGMIARYMFEIDGRKHYWDVDPVTLDSDIHHDKLFHPLDDYYGMSPVEAGAYGIDQHNEANALGQALLQNSARPSGALTTDGDLSNDGFNRLKAQMEEQYQGSRNAGRPMLLEGGLKWQQMAFSPRDMEILQAKYSSARDVCLAFGVPPLLLGLPGDNTYANYAEARLAFYEERVIPLANRLARDWTEWLGPKFGDVEIKADFDHVPAMVAKNQALWDMADKATDLTLNERRELKGYGPVPEGDVILVGSMQIPLAEAVAPIDPPLIGDDAVKVLGYDGVEVKAEE